MADDLDPHLHLDLSHKEAEKILRQLGGTDRVAPVPIQPAPVPPSPEPNRDGSPTPTAALPLQEIPVDALRRLLDAVPDALVVVDRCGRLVLVNPRTEVLFGYSRDELLGQPIELLVPDRFRAGHISLRNGYIAEPAIRPMGIGRELVGRRKDGNEVPIEISLSPLDSESGSLVVANIRDVTERRKAEAQLRKMEKRYRKLVEGIPAVTFMAALDEVGTRELYVSPQIEELLGFSQREWLDNPILWYTQLHPDDQSRWHKEFARTIGEGKPFRSVYRFIARDGRVVWVHGEAQLVRDDEGRPQFLQGVAFDITGIKQAEENLKALNATLEQRVAERTTELVRSNAALGLFASTAAHELKVPLLTIRGKIDRLARINADNLDEKGRDDITRVQMAGDRMARLIKGLLDYAKFRTEERPRVPVDCAEALRWACEQSGAEAVSELPTDPIAIDNALKYRIEESDVEITAGGLPTVLADLTGLAQIFQNLIGNALKYRSERPPRVHVTARRQGAEWVIEVKDNGIGIEHDYLEKIFKLGVISRLHSENKIPGDGIGLTTCETIVQQYGGRIWAESDGPDKGTKILFTMPAAE